MGDAGGSLERVLRQDRVLGKNIMAYTVFGEYIGWVNGCHVDIYINSTSTHGYLSNEFRGWNNTLAKGMIIDSFSPTDVGNAGTHTFTVNGRMDAATATEFSLQTPFTISMPITFTGTADPPVPGVPSSISVSPSPATVGGTISISWSSSTNTTSYQLERRIGSGSWTQIYSGSSTSYSDTAQVGWSTVTYRVRSLGPGGTSGYRTGSAITVNSVKFRAVGNNGTYSSQDGMIWSSS